MILSCVASLASQVGIRHCLQIEDLSGVTRSERARMPRCGEMVCIEGVPLIMICMYDIRQRSFGLEKSEVSVLLQGCKACQPLSVP